MILIRIGIYFQVHLTNILIQFIFNHIYQCMPDEKLQNVVEEYDYHGNDRPIRWNIMLLMLQELKNRELFVFEKHYHKNKELLSYAEYGPPGERYGEICKVQYEIAFNGYYKFYHQMEVMKAHVRSLSEKEIGIY